MKTRLVIALTSLVLAVVLPACGGPTEYQLFGTSHGRGTDGTILLETTDSGTRIADIELEHLIPPSRIEDNLTVYVIWFKADGESPTKAGYLNYDPDDRTAEAHVTTALAGALTLLITAELDNTASSPSEHIIVKQALQ